MIRMLTAAQIVMHTRIRKGIIFVSGAVTAAVNMKRKYWTVACPFAARQACNFGAYDHAASDKIILCREYPDIFHCRLQTPPHWHTGETLSLNLYNCSFCTPLRLFVTVYAAIVKMFPGCHPVTREYITGALPRLPRAFLAALPRPPQGPFQKKKGLDRQELSQRGRRGKRTDVKLR